MATKKNSFSKLKTFLAILFISSLIVYAFLYVSSMAKSHAMFQKIISLVQDLPKVENAKEYLKSNLSSNESSLKPNVTDEDFLFASTTFSSPLPPCMHLEKGYLEGEYGSTTRGLLTDNFWKIYWIVNIKKSENPQVIQVDKYIGPFRSTGSLPNYSEFKTELQNTKSKATGFFPVKYASNC